MEIKTSRQIREKDDKIQDFSKGMKFENKKWVALDVLRKDIIEQKKRLNEVSNDPLSTSDVHIMNVGYQNALDFVLKTLKED